MSRLCYFYATHADIIAVTDQVEFKACLQYVRYGHTSKLPPESFDKARHIPNLGTATHSSAVGCEKFLVCESGTAIKPGHLKTLTRQHIQRSGGSLDAAGLDGFAIDQLINPDTITFSPAGIWQERILLHGSIGTASQSELSELLMRRFRAAIKRAFVEVRAFYVGPEALKLLNSGMRLTIADQSPAEYDLKLE